jgi:ATP-binding cassette, subfamily B, bacterial
MTETPAASRPTLQSLKPFARWLLKYRGRIALGFISLIVASAATLAIPLAIRRVVDHGFGAGEGIIDAYFVALTGVVGVLAVASAFRYYLVTTLGERVIADIREDLFTRLVRLDVAFYDQARTGELIGRLASDTAQLKNAFGVSASIALRNLFLFVGATVMMVYSSPKLSGLVLVAMPLIVLPLVGAARKLRSQARIAQDQLAETTAFANEQIGAIRTIKAFGAENRISGRYRSANDAAYDARRYTLLSRSLVTGIAIFLIFAAIVGVIWLGASDVANGVMSGGELSQFILYAVFAAGGLSQLSEVWTELSAAAGSAERMGELLEMTPKIDDQGPLTGLSFNSLAFEDVRFAYPSQSGRDVLGPLSFSVQPGERIAIVGPSGGGKSTVIQLLMRFYDVTAGQILAGQTPFSQLQPSDIRRNIALVPQDPVIFATSILENIRYSKPEASLEEVKRASALAAADGFITALPQGYDTMVGERGVTLSGGQRQRIAIARALLKNAPILLLDEATSALDAENEAAVQTALDTLMRGRTSVVIAHRLATITEADRILVIDKGRIVEQGNHESLVSAGGLYARLAALQFAANANDDERPVIAAE